MPTARLMQTELPKLAAFVLTLALAACASDRFDGNSPDGANENIPSPSASLPSEMGKSLPIHVLMPVLMTTPAPSPASPPQAMTLGKTETASASVPQQRRRPRSQRPIYIRWQEATALGSKSMPPEIRTRSTSRTSTRKEPSPSRPTEEALRMMPLPIMLTRAMLLPEAVIPEAATPAAATPEAAAPEAAPPPRRPILPQQPPPLPRRYAAHRRRCRFPPRTDYRNTQPPARQPRGECADGRQADRCRKSANDIRRGRSMRSHDTGYQCLECRAYSRRKRRHCQSRREGVPQFPGLRDAGKRAGGTRSSDPQQRNHRPRPPPAGLFRVQYPRHRRQHPARNRSPAHLLQRDAVGSRAARADIRRSTAHHHRGLHRRTRNHRHRHPRPLGGDGLRRVRHRGAIARKEQAEEQLPELTKHRMI